MKNFFGRVFSTVVGIIIFFGISFGLLLMILAISSIGSWFSEKGIKKNSVLEIKLDNTISEGTTDTKQKLFDFKKEETIYYKDILDMISSAKSDDKIRGISLKLSSFIGGETQRDEIRRSLANFKTSGKFVYAYQNYTDQDSYYINSVADSVYLNPVGGFDFIGKSIEVLFYKNLGDKYGIDFQVIRHGKFKGAVEPFIRTDLSPENKQQYSELLNGIWKNMITDISKSRKIDTLTLNIIADSIYSIIPAKALEHKLVDALVQESQYDSIIMKKLKVSDKKHLNVVSLAEYKPKSKIKYEGKKQIAVIYACGQIFDGNGTEGIYSEDFKSLIKDLKEDDKVKAVVLRVNSPGGSANASDEILYELQQLKAKKPLIVSFGEYAASGGYYIAMGGDKIFSEKNTLTGSIGVFGMIPNFKQLANNVGITSDQIKTNENSVFVSPFKKLSTSGRSIIEKSIENTYKRFVLMVQKNRKMTFEQVDAIGGGRVWTGEKAKQIGLVDEIGSLDDAIRYAAEKAKIKDNFKINSYPKAKDNFEEFINRLSGINAKSIILKEELGEENYKIYEQVKSLKNNNRVMMMMPYTLEIK